MTGDERKIRQLAAAVADGLPVDWRQAETTSDDESERAVVQQLRLLASLADVHRTGEATVADDGWSGSGSMPPEGDTEPTQWGPLEIRELVGSGGYGTVYRAWDPQLHREVALKLLNDDRASDPIFQQSVIAEGRRLARVRHQNVIAVYGADSNSGRVGFWMEFLEGQTLKQWLDSQGALNSREATLIGIELCRALAAVHAAGLVHRDVKAQNVMREAGGRTVLMDFGTGSETGQRARLAGTPLYMAPELFTGSIPSHLSDIYSLGVLLFYLVSNEFPVAGATLDVIKRAHSAGTRRTVRDVRPDLPSAFVRVVDRALSPDPAARPATAGALEAELAASLELHVESARRRQDASGVWRHWRWWVMATGLILAVLGSFWMSGLIPGTHVIVPLKASQVRSLAVLPLENLSGVSQDYFSNGMTELLTANLSKLQDLQVIARSSVMKYKDGTTPPREVADALHVDALIQGSVLRDGDHLRVTANLVSGRDQTSLWAEVYEGDVHDAFALQSKVAQDIARSINLRLSPQDQQKLSATHGTGNDQARDEYLRGWAAAEPATVEGAQQAIVHFEKAITLDPAYADAYSGVAQAYWSLNLNFGQLSPLEAYTKARTAALKALELDDTVATAHYTLGKLQFTYEWDFAAADASFHRALDLDPNNADAHEQYGWYLASRGRLDEALREMQRGCVLDPLLHTRRSALAAVLYYMGRQQDALQTLNEALALSKDPGWLRIQFARVYAAKGMADEALAQLAPTAAWKPTFRIQAERARILAQAGRRREARALLDDLESRPESEAAPDSLAFVHFALGDKDGGFDLLDRAVSQRLPGALWIKVDPRFDTVRTDPRFARLVERVGI